MVDQTVVVGFSSCALWFWSDCFSYGHYIKSNANTRAHSIQHAQADRPTDGQTDVYVYHNIKCVYTNLERAIIYLIFLFRLRFFSSFIWLRSHNDYVINLSVFLNWATGSSIFKRLIHIFIFRSFKCFQPFQ